MEPHQARMTFAAFLALSVSIAFNALYLQTDRGFAARAPIGNPTARGEATGPVDRDLQKRIILVQAIERELSGRNYFPGRSGARRDGRIAPMTVGAIMAYQHDHRIGVTGRPTDRLLKTFLFGVDKAARRTAFARSSNLVAEKLTAEVQGILSAEGYYKGRLDGVFGKGTRAAIQRFETARGLPVTSRVSGLLVQELNRITGVEFSTPKL